MFCDIEKLKIESVMYGNASLLKTYIDRQTHGFVFKLTGHSRYTFPSGEIFFPEHTILFIPRGADYTVRRLTEGESRYGLINFHAHLREPRPTLYRPDDFVRAENLLEQMSRLWLFPTESNRYACLSLFYGLLSQLARGKDRQHLDPEKRALLEPAVRYLEKHIFDPELRTESLHLLCGISDVYFRRLFCMEFGVSPRNYVISKRLAQAKSILTQGEYTHIYEVARSVGYTDALYFSRAYKNRYGASPGKT